MSFRALTACALAFSWLVLTITPATGEEQCDGVTVVVDDGADVEARCAPADVNGLQALDAAGFTVHATHNGGFVCQIDSRPDKDECEDSAHHTSWNYFYAGSGGSWHSSNLGAGNREVIKGGYEGWHLGPNTPPDYEIGDATPAQEPASGDSNSGSYGNIATWAAAAAVLALLAATLVIAGRRRQRRY